MIDRPKFTEYTSDQLHLFEEGDTRYDTFELKMDGIWGCMMIKDGEYQIYSRTSKIKKTGKLPFTIVGEYTFLGEFMKGSHWGHKMGYDGHFFIFDCLKWRDSDLQDFSLGMRRRKVKMFIDIAKEMASKEDNKWLKVLPYMSIDKLVNFWDIYVKDKAYEGVVLKDSMSTYNEDKAWARIKNRAEIEYMCIGFEPADSKSRYAGQVGAVLGSLVDKPCKVQCGGLSDVERMLFTEDPDLYIGRVFSATGHGFYPSGSLRHPKFGKWRDDKYAMDCTYDQIPEIIRED